jgi:hypothetical protein
MSYDKHYSKWQDFLSTGEAEKSTAQEGASISKRQQGAPPRDTDAVVADIVKELAAQPLSEQVRDSNISQLHEVSAEEVEAIQPMLDRLAKEGTSILPFADVFGDKTRIVVPYESTGFTEEGKELQQTLNYMGFTFVGDGIIERPITKTIPAGTDKDGNEIEPREIKTKERYKIGKFLSKLHAVVERYRKLEHVRAELTKKNKEKRERGDDVDDDWLNAPETAEEKQFRRAVNDIRKVTGNIENPYLNAWSEYYGYPAKGVEKIERLQKLWQQKAGDIVGAYKLIVSRSPIDVFRMSDFKNIQSCHSPASIDDGDGGSYWQCAVAEAYGEGAIAYVVADKDLAALTGVDRNADASEFEAVIQDGEIFSDKFLASGERGEAGSNKFSGEDLINPVSRIRIRLARWLDHREDNPEPIDLMVPETAVYGGSGSGLREALDEWVKSVQPNADEKILASAREKGFVWLDGFTFFGGNYSDNSRAGLLKTYLNSIAGKDLEYEGMIRTNTDTEDAITLAGRLEPDYQQRLDMEAELKHWSEMSNWGAKYSYLEGTGQNKYVVLCHMPFTFDNAQDNHNGDLYFNGGESVKGGNAPHNPRNFFRMAKGRVQDYVKKASNGVIIRQVEHPWFEGNQVRVEMVFGSDESHTLNEWIYGRLQEFDREVEKLRKSPELIGYVKRNLMLGGALNGGEFLNYVIEPPKESEHSVWERKVTIINDNNDGFVELTADIDLTSLPLQNLSTEDVIRAASSKDFEAALNRAVSRGISRYRDEAIPPLGIDATVYNDGKSLEIVMMFDHQSPDSLVDAIVLAESVIFHKLTIAEVIENASSALLSGGKGDESLQEASRVVGNWKKFLKG